MNARTPDGEAATRVILSTLRTNGLLLAAGDTLASEEGGLTPARWQVLGAIALAGQPVTVPQIARRMGLTRQSVHSTVNHLVHDGLAARILNADHRRSQLIRLTDAGMAAYSAIDARQAAWVNDLAEGIGRRKLDAAAALLDELSRRLEAQSATAQAIPKGTRDGNAIGSQAAEDPPARWASDSSPSAENGTGDTLIPR
jgi:DNA-binding MarR family transcriptional regulator